MGAPVVNRPTEGLQDYSHRHGQKVHRIGKDANKVKGTSGLAAGRTVEVIKIVKMENKGFVWITTARKKI